jgi:hypothetical protein
MWLPFGARITRCRGTLVMDEDMIANLAPTPLFHSHRKVSVERMKPLQQGFTFLGFAGFISEEPGRGRPAAGWATAHDRVTVIGERRVLRPKRSASAASSRLHARSAGQLSCQPAGAVL